MLSSLTITRQLIKPFERMGFLPALITISNQTTTSYVTPIVTDILDTSLVNFV